MKAGHDDTKNLFKDVATSSSTAEVVEPRSAPEKRWRRPTSRTRKTGQASHDIPVWPVSTKFGKDTRCARKFLLTPLPALQHERLLSTKSKIDVYLLPQDLRWCGGQGPLQPEGTKVSQGKREGRQSRMNLTYSHRHTYTHSYATIPLEKQLS